MQKQVNFVVTDLDDTLWDWLEMWYKSFNPFLERISNELCLDIEELKKDFKQLHQKYGTSEASFIIDELKLLSDDQRKKIIEDVSGSKGIMHEYNSNKKNNLKLHEGVFKTLCTIKAKGAKIIGFTESHSFYTKYRLKTLNLDGLIDCIYAPVDRGIPETVKKFYPEGYWEPKATEFRYLAREVKKPNAEILEIILKDFNAQKENTIYIGDKLDRDIYMAQQAGITSAHAKYGYKTDGLEYDLLRQVTHWTDEDVKREIEFKKDANAKLAVPDVVLINSFAEILETFEFYSFDKADNNDDAKNTIEIWKKVIDVQQHFNDLELRIRNYALSLFTATVAGVGLLEKEKIEFTFYGLIVPASSLLSFVGLLVLIAFWYMDKYWYHKLLLGAVKQGISIENRNAGMIPELGLTKAIGESSPHTFKWKWWGKARQIKIHSSDKYYIFYGLLFIPLIILTAGLIIGHQKGVKDNKPVESVRGISEIRDTIKVNDTSLVTASDTVRIDDTSRLSSPTIKRDTIKK